MDLDIYGVRFNVSYALTSSQLSELYNVENCVGYCDPNPTFVKMIFVANDISYELKKSTLIHEILEALKYVLNINIKHNDIIKLENGLNYVINNNDSLGWSEMALDEILTNSKNRGIIDN